jgi:predicted transcriptional regulator
LLFLVTLLWYFRSLHDDNQLHPGVLTEEEVMKDKKTIKRDILGKFRALNAESNDLLPPHWLELVYLKNLNSEEKKLFKKAIQELTTVGIVENVEGPSLNLRLSQKGENLIYSSENQKSSRESGAGKALFEFTSSEA